MENQDSYLILFGEHLKKELQHFSFENFAFPYLKFDGK